MNIKQSKTPARDAYAAHLAFLAEQAVAIGNRNQMRNRMHADIQAAKEQLATYDQAKSSFRALLGAFAAGEVPDTEVAAARTRMAEQDAQAESLRQAVEVGEAGIEHMDRLLAPMHELVRNAQEDLKRLERAARIELATNYVPAYIAAAQAFADAHCALTGACLYVDESAEGHEQWVRSVLWQPTLEIPLPRLPSVLAPFTHTFDLLEATEKGKAAAAEAFAASVA